jgi:hypothetical protein
MMDLRYRQQTQYAGIAQLVERNLAKVEVASSNLVSRSRFRPGPRQPARAGQKPRPNRGFCFPGQCFFGTGFPVVQFHGAVAEWLCSGLQLRIRRFDSDPRLHIIKAVLKQFPGRTSGPAHPARVAKLVDAWDLKSLVLRGVRVRVPPRAPDARPASEMPTPSQSP